MPAAAVIPAPVAYIKAVAVKKLVVGSWAQICGPPRGVYCSSGLPLGFCPVLLTECRVRPERLL